LVAEFRKNLLTFDSQRAQLRGKLPNLKHRRGIRQEWDKQNWFQMTSAKISPASANLCFRKYNIFMAEVYSGKETLKPPRSMRAIQGGGVSKNISPN